MKQNMAFFILRTVIFAYLHACLVAKGENIVVTDKAPCWEGRNHTLSCKLEELSLVVQWRYIYENDFSIITHCYRNICDLNTDYVGQYHFSYDLSQYIFNLTIINVTKNKNRGEFVCTDGTNSDCKILYVDETKPAVHEDIENGFISVTSACFYNDTNVSFKWTKIDATNGEEIEIRPKIINKTDTPCSKLSTCGNKQQIRHIETFSTEPNGNGPMNYKLEVVYGSERIESMVFTAQYIIDDRDAESEEHANKGLAIGLVIAGVCIGIGLVIGLVIRKRQWFRKMFIKILNSRKHEEFTEMESFLNPGTLTNGQKFESSKDRGGQVIRDHDFYREVLNRSHMRFNSELDTTPLLDLFLEEEFLQYSQVRDIQEMKSTAEKTREISKIVLPKGGEGYETYKRLLRESKQEHLADYLEQKESELEKELMVEKEKEHKRQHETEEFTIENEKEHNEEAELEKELMVEKGKEHKEKSELEKELMVEKEKEHKEKAELEKKLMVEKEKEHKEKAELEKELMVEKEKEHKEKAELEKELMVEKGKERKEKSELEKELMVEKEKEHKEKHDRKASRQTRTDTRTGPHQIKDLKANTAEEKEVMNQTVDDDDSVGVWIHLPIPDLYPTMENANLSFPPLKTGESSFPLYCESKA